MVLNDYPANPYAVRSLVARGVKSVVMVPIKTGERTLGIMGVGSRQHGHFTPARVRFISAVADGIGALLEYAMLYDHLEGSHNAIQQHQSELQHAEEFNQRLIAAMPSAVLVVKPDLEVVAANKTCSRILGLRKRVVVGKRIPNVLRMNGIRPIVNAALKSKGAIKEREIIYPHPTKGRRWFRVNAARLYDEDSNTENAPEPQIILTLDDVTEWHQAQGKVQETSRLISLGEIIGSVAHELNNPLTSVMGFAQLLAEQEQNEHNKVELGIILSEAQRATKVVRNLLDFVRKRQIERNWVDLPATLKRTLALKSYDLGASNIRVETVFPADMPKAYVDEHQMEQVFLNIVTNAQQAMASTHQRGRLIISAETHDKFVRISFQDDGPGIPSESLTSIFDPFVTTKKPGEGTGLGLSICKGLVQEQRGKIWAESKEGEGSTFCIELPIRKN